MPFSSENLLKQLDQPGNIDWALELKHGKKAYAFLMTAVGRPALKTSQTRNGLRALFLIRGHGSSSEVLQKFIDLAVHPSRTIRSHAVQLAVGLSKFSVQCEKVQVPLSSEQEKRLRTALELGLTNKAAKLTQKYFSTPAAIRTGGIGIISPELSLELNSPNNSLVLKTGARWTGADAKKTEIAILFAGRIWSPSTLPDSFCLTNAVVVSFERHQIQWIDFRKMALGSYRR